MKLFLTSSTITPNLIRPFEKIIGKSSQGLKAAFIPDAGSDQALINEDMNDVINDLKWRVDKITLANENVATLHKLFEYEVIYVNGGYSGHLAKIMKKSGFDKLLPLLLDKGIVYVGSSAGSMVLSKVQDAASFYFGEPEPEALKIGGLGLVDFELYPMHDSSWSEDLVEKIKAKRNKKLKYYLLRDGQAVSVENGIITSYGDVLILEKEN